MKCDTFLFIFVTLTGFRDVAQPGSALRSGRRGRWFESSHPDFHKLYNEAIVSLITHLY